MVCREGNKQGIAKLILELIPAHTCYVEPFCGMGGIFLNKPRAKYNLLNDIDDFVYDFWNCLLEDKERLIREVNKYPIYARILRDFGADKHENVAKRLLLINTSFLGYEESPLKTCFSNKRELLLKKLIWFMGDNTKIFNLTYVKFITALAFRSENDTKNTFIYNDPPYLFSKGNLKSNKGWSNEDLHTLIDLLNQSGCKYMISEMNDPRVIDIFEENGLYIHYIGKNKMTQTQGKQKQEIVAINYKIDNSLF